MKVIIFNLKFGSNLGDRLISRCIEAEIKQSYPAIEVVGADLAGRDVPGSMGGKRLIALFVLDHLPAWLRVRVAEQALRRNARTRLRPKWRQLLLDADAIVIGGGGILADSDLNFPIKIDSVLQEAAVAGLPVAVYAVGVTTQWSAKGRAIFARGFAAVRLALVGVRDAESGAAWEAHFADAGLEAPQITLDPGFLLYRHFAGASVPRRTIGLCVTSPTALQYHRGGNIQYDWLDRWYIEVAKALASNGHPVAIFTTGTPEDVAYCIRLRRNFHRGKVKSDGLITFLPELKETDEFIAFLSQCMAFVSHRLHVLIPAYSFRIPAIGLLWDAKIQAQSNVLGYPDRLIDPSTTEPVEVAKHVARIIGEGIDDDLWHKAVVGAQDGLDRLMMALQRDVGANGK